MKNLSHLFAVICCFVLLVNRPAYAQEAGYVYVIATYKTVMSEGGTEVERASRLPELIEAHKASGKVLSLKDLRQFYGDDSHDWVGITGYASRSDTSATTSKKANKTKSRIVGAVIGGVIGALSGFVLSEIFTPDIGLCNEGDPGCTTETNRTEVMILFGFIGLMVGAAVGV